MVSKAESLAGKMRMNQSLYTGKSLCICLTPLHVLIANRVRENNTQTFDLGIYMSYQHDAKQDFYFRKMKSFCKDIEFVKTPKEIYPAGINKYITIYKRRTDFLRKFYSYGKFNYVLASSSINHYLWSLIQSSDPDRLETYDDGLLNIAKTPVHHYQKTSFLDNLFLNICGIRLNKEKMIEQSARHYSIYEQENWFSRVSYLPLHKIRNKSSIGHQHETFVEVFLGPSPETDASIWALIEDYLRKNPNTLFLRHPRDQENRFDFLTSLHTKLIVEDYVIEQIQETGTNFTITGTESSALINLSTMPNVRTQSILPKRPEFHESRTLMAKLGVHLIHRE